MDSFGVLPTNSSGFVGGSSQIRQVLHQIEIVGPSQTTVLLQGESGTGKELAARAIHNASHAINGPFVAINCAAFPESLIESELFGHERGAFTGADKMRKGRFELANGGTLFLDEVGELGPRIQAKFLRVLQEREFERLGGMNTIAFNARVIAASNRDLADMTANGSFRRDLLFRLNVFTIHIPPLRERQDDILPLAAHFLRRHINKISFSRKAADLLRCYPWPGNARELANVMERAALLMGAAISLEPEHLPAEILASQPEANFQTNLHSRDKLRNLLDPDLISGNEKLIDLKQEIAELELAYIKAALELSKGRIQTAAGFLGLTLREMGLRMRKYGLDYKEFRQKS